MERSGSPRSTVIVLVVASALGAGDGCTGAKWTETQSGTLRFVANRGGRTLGYSSTSGVKLVFDGSFAFKDLNRTGTLEPYEDGRLAIDERARDLAGRMSVEQIAGLMLYSAHQAIPAVGGFRPSTYGGKPFEESGADPSDLLDQQRDLIGELLRGKYGYDGVVCTDWGITDDETAVDAFSGRPFGVEHLSRAERHYRVIMAGGDQFGGNNDAEPVVEAFRLGVAEHGEAAMRARFEQSAVRLLRNMLRTGLFENPYLDVETTAATVGRPEFMTAGYAAQLKSIVMLKNRDKALPFAKTTTVYVPRRHKPPRTTFFGRVEPGSLDYPVNMDIVKKYFALTDDPGKADVALVFVESPDGGTGYDRADRKAGGNGYVPISLQYGRYTAEHARATSIAGGDPFEEFTNRSYRGKTVTSVNASDLTLIRDTRKAMGRKPLVVSVALARPMVFRELEKDVDAILVTFGVQDQAVLDVLSGAAEPSGLLPLQMPASMKMVEEQQEDVPRDMACHVDSEGHAYDFGFGLSWSGVIDDARTARYASGS